MFGLFPLLVLRRKGETLSVPELDAGHFYWTRPDPAQSFEADQKSKNVMQFLID